MDSVSDNSGRITNDYRIRRYIFGNDTPPYDGIVSNCKSGQNYTSHPDDAIIFDMSIRYNSATMVMRQNHRLPQDPDIIPDIDSFGIDGFIQVGRPRDPTTGTDMHSITPPKPRRIGLLNPLPQIFSHIFHCMTVETERTDIVKVRCRTWQQVPVLFSKK